VGIGLTKIFYLKSSIAKPSMIILLIAMNVGLFHLTRQQTMIWKNDLTLWSYAAIYSPDSALIQGNLGYSYFFLGDYEKALKHYRLALPNDSQKPHSKQRIYFDIGGVYYNAAVACLRLRYFQEALFYFNVILNNQLDIEHTYEVVYYQMGWIYSQMGQVAEARTALTKALEINPQYQLATELLAQLEK
jgi:tetratricopeptide (TPR) repeat protein